MRRARITSVLGCLSLLAFIAIPSAEAAGRSCSDPGPDAISGTSGDDVLQGGPLGDVIVGGGGDDIIFGQGGNDKLCGGGGGDELHGSIGQDVLDGGEGNDELSAGFGYDRLIPGPGNDFVDGGTLPDQLDFRGDMPHMVVNLEAGMSTGDGSDTIVNIEDILGSSAGVTAIGTASSNALFVRGGPNSLQAGGGDDMILGDNVTGSNDLAGGVGDDDIESYGPGEADLIGGAGDDFLFGFGGGETYDGGEDDDVIVADDGPTDVDGGSGRDKFEPSFAESGIQVDLAAGTVSGSITGPFLGIEDVDGTRRSDVLSGDEQANRLAGQDRDDTLHGRMGDDTLIGDDGWDTLEGGAGDDSLDGGLGGRDFLDGGTGWDACHGGEKLSGCEATSWSDKEETSGPLDIRISSAELYERNGARGIRFGARFFEGIDVDEFGHVTFRLDAIGGDWKAEVDVRRVDDHLEARIRSQSGNVETITFEDVELTPDKGLRVLVPLSSLSDDPGDVYLWHAKSVPPRRLCNAEGGCVDLTPDVRASLTP